MFQKKIKWYLLFESKEEFDALFNIRNSVVHKTMFGEYLMIRDQGNYYAFKNKCPHQKKSLEGCTINNGNIICPFHQYQFSLENGRGHGLYIDKFPIKIDATGVFVGKEVFSLF